MPELKTEIEIDEDSEDGEVLDSDEEEIRWAEIREHLIAEGDWYEEDEGFLEMKSKLKSYVNQLLDDGPDIGDCLCDDDELFYPHSKSKPKSSKSRHSQSQHRHGMSRSDLRSRSKSKVRKKKKKNKNTRNEDVEIGTRITKQMTKNLSGSKKGNVCDCYWNWKTERGAGAGAGGTGAGGGRSRKWNSYCIQGIGIVLVVLFASFWFALFHTGGMVHESKCWVNRENYCETNTGKCSKPILGFVWCDRSGNAILDDIHRKIENMNKKKKQH